MANALTRHLPSWKNAALALLAAGLLILAFPDFEFWFLAWFALVPLMWAIDRQSHCVTACFFVGWLFGTTFFFGTCWWLTYAPIHYAAVPWPLAYLLIFIVCLAAGIFPGIFALILSILIRRFGTRAFLAAPFVWVMSEFARYWITGNNWNAIGYSQAFEPFTMALPSIGGLTLVSFVVVLFNSLLVRSVLRAPHRWSVLQVFRSGVWNVLLVAILVVLSLDYWIPKPRPDLAHNNQTQLIAVQANVPMSGLNSVLWTELRDRHAELAVEGLDVIDRRLRFDAYRLEVNDETLRTPPRPPTVVVLPESPMNFAYNDDRELRQFIGDFARQNNVGVIFNSSQPDKTNGKYFNSAVMVGPDGKIAAEYDKIYLLPFGEAVPSALEGIVPAFVGHFSYGSKYDLMPLGDAKAGVMICFESHFGELGRRYVQNGADAIVEMTNDGYLGPTPVLRQHLANAVFRAVETNRPVLRVTNVGITAYITPRGKVLDLLPVYQEGTRVWSISKSNGSQTFYVKYGDWFAWLCVIVTMALIAFSLRLKHEVAEARASARAIGGR